mgnify:CR=1 FL=1
MKYDELMAVFRKEDMTDFDFEYLEYDMKKSMRRDNGVVKGYRAIQILGYNTGQQGVSVSPPWRPLIRQKFGEIQFDRVPNKVSRNCRGEYGLYVDIKKLCDFGESAYYLFPDTSIRWKSNHPDGLMKTIYTETPLNERKIWLLLKNQEKSALQMD